MKRLIITVFYLICSSIIIYGQNHDAEYVLINSLIPKDWNLLEYKKGDLNKDMIEIMEFYPKFPQKFSLDNRFYPKKNQQHLQS